MSPELGAASRRRPRIGRRLELRQLRVVYRQRDGSEITAVRGVDLDVGRGEAVGLFGASGCGKSSLILGAFGLTPPTAEIKGEVRLDGERLDSKSEKEWTAIRGRRVGLVFQQPALALHPLRSIGGQLADVVRAHTGLGRRRIRERCRELIAELELEEAHLEARPHQLSGGQQQRAVLALALAAEPGLLVADEPTAALDQDTETAVLELVQRLQASRELSLLWISHDPDVLGRVCDRLAVMAGGRIVESGPAREVLRAPSHAATRELLSHRLYGA